MIKAADILEVPILWSEQAPEKIGVTIPEIAELLAGLTPIKKTSFSCYREKAFKQALLRTKRHQIMMVGIEAHVCIYQTAADLLDHGFEVQVVADAVSSRREQHKTIALQRLAQMGVGITCTEMMVTELLAKAQGGKFKAILNLIK